MTNTLDIPPIAVVLKLECYTGLSTSSFPFSSQTINYFCQGSKICNISLLLPRLTFSCCCWVGYFFKNHWRRFCEKMNETALNEKSTKSRNVAPELFRCKSDQFIPNKVNKLLERSIVLYAISLSLNLSFSLSGKQNGQKPIRLYWKCCTFFYL